MLPYLKRIGIPLSFLTCDHFFLLKILENLSTLTLIRALKVAYYSFQKRKITFLKLSFKANRSFLLGHLLLQLLKEMILTLIIL